MLTRSWILFACPSPLSGIATIARTLVRTTRAQCFVSSAVPATTTSTFESTDANKSSSKSSRRKNNNIGAGDVSLDRLMKWKKKEQNHHHHPHKGHLHDNAMIVARQQQNAWEHARRIFSEKVEKPLAEEIFQNNENKNNVVAAAEQEEELVLTVVPANKANISAATLLLGSLRFFDSSRSDLMEKLFSIVARGFLVAPKKKAAVNSNKRNDGTKNSMVVTATSVQIPRRTYFDATYALHSCAMCGFVRAADLDTVLNGICAGRHELDAGSLVRCIVSMVLFSGFTSPAAPAVASSSSSSSSSSISSSPWRQQPPPQHFNDPFTLLLRTLASLPPHKLHDGSIKTSTALQFLACIDTRSFGQKPVDLRRFRALHLVEHMCAIVAGRSSSAAAGQVMMTMGVVEDKGSNNNKNSNHTLLGHCPITRTRVPCPEQLHQAHRAAVRLGLRFHWLERQLFDEAVMCQGVVTTTTSGNSDHADDDDGSFSSFASNSRRGGGADHIVDPSYPVMNYVEQFGDDDAPNQTLVPPSLVD